MALLRVVLDTNLLVSYLLTQGNTISRIITHWADGDIEVVVSPAIMEELAGVVRRPRLSRPMAGDPQILIDLLSSEALHTKGDVAFPGASRDPKDDKFLACAIEGAADYIVTGDADLLSLGTFRTVRIVRPAEFVQLFNDAEGAA